jgi:hypothetical protein
VADLPIEHQEVGTPNHCAQRKMSADPHAPAGLSISLPSGHDECMPGGGVRRRSPSVAAAAVLLVAWAVLGGCTRDDEADTPTLTLRDLEGRDFDVKRLVVDGEALHVLPALTGRPQTIGFHDGRIVVSTACNSGAANIVSLDDGTLDVLEVASEALGCPDVQLRQEAVVYRLLASDPSVTLHADVLALSGSRITLEATERSP